MRPRRRTVAPPIAATLRPTLSLGVLLAEQGALAEAEAAFGAPTSAATRARRPIWVSCWRSGAR